MSVQVLLATMKQKNFDFLPDLNIQSDILIGNQADFNEVSETTYQGHQAKMYSFAERGVGLNRNNTLMRATADYCLIADDDMVYVDNYPELVEKAFAALPDADVIIFNLHEKNTVRYVNKSTYRVRLHNFMRFGAARLAIKTESIHLAGIHFNLCFGGGTEHSNGEDTIFLHDCLRSGLKIYAVPEYIATLREDSESTWFTGYTDKYLRDKGLVYSIMFRRLRPVMAVLDALKYGKRYNRAFSDIVKNIMYYK